MILVRAATAVEVMDAFQRDSLVTKLGKPWPPTPEEKGEILRQAGRPADKILQLAWALYRMDRTEFLDNVRTVWTRGSVSETITAYRADRLPKNHMDKVRRLVGDMARIFREEEFLLIGYRETRGARLEEGHHHAVAAEIANVLPASVQIYLGA